MRTTTCINERCSFYGVQIPDSDRLRDENRESCPGCNWRVTVQTGEAPKPTDKGETTNA